MTVGLSGTDGVVVAPSSVPDQRRTPLRANFAWTVVGNTVYAACQWGMLLVIARLCDPAEVGRFAAGFAVSAPVFLLAGMQIRSVLVTDTARRFQFSDYAGVTILGMMAALAATALIISPSGQDRETSLVVLAVACCKAIEGTSEVYYGSLHRVERMRPIAVALVWRGVLGILALTAVLWAGGTVFLAVAALGAVWLGVLLVHTLPRVGSLLRASGETKAPRLRWLELKRVVAIALPLGVVNMLVSLRANIPRYAIEGVLGVEDLGVFAALSSLVFAGNLLIGALGQAVTPRLARYHTEGRMGAFRHLLGLLLGFAVLLGVAGVGVSMMAGGPLLRLLFGQRYQVRADLLTWLMVAGMVSYTSSLLGFALTAVRRFMIQVPLFACSAAVCALACGWLVPSRGLTGAAWGWGAPFLLELIAMAILLRQAARRRGAGG